MNYESIRGIPIRLQRRGRVIYLFRILQVSQTQSFEQGEGELTGCAAFEIVSSSAGKSHDLPPGSCGVVGGFGYAFAQRDIDAQYFGVLRSRTQSRGGRQQFESLEQADDVPTQGPAPDVGTGA